MTKLENTDENKECFANRSPNDLKQKMAMFQRIMDTVVRKYHVHKDIWPPETGKSFLRRQGSNNEHDRYAVALYANENYPEPGGSSSAGKH